MKKNLFIPLVLLFFTSVSAEESRNQYSNSIMFEAPESFNDASHKTEIELHNQHCRDLQKRIKDLKHRPVRRNAASERYKKECLNK